MAAAQLDAAAVPFMAGASRSENAALSGRDTEAPSRASPELGVSEIQGQYHDTTSGLAFVHRAYRRLSKEASETSGQVIHPETLEPDNEDSPTLAVGDKPLDSQRHGRVQLPSLARAKQLVHLYFDICMATYRFLHLPTVEAWLEAACDNARGGLPLHRGIGRARAAIILIVLAIATAHEDKASGDFQLDEKASMEHIDTLFTAASALVQQETASPTLESAQARLMQVLYLLTTSRFNQAWYEFGIAVQLISALSLHRKQKVRRGHANQDYVVAELRKRTFWSAYILDKYLGVIFGRPRHYNDEDIDQDAPDRVNDEDMSPAGVDPGLGRRRDRKDCSIDALIHHATIASILSDAARSVYSIKQTSQQDRIAAAHRLGEELRQWRAGLPPHLGVVHPTSLIPVFRRQSITLKIAHCHASMHINRLFLLEKVSSESGIQISEAIVAAHTVLETVDDLVAEQGTIFHAFWWTHYVTFCALAIIYAWEVRRSKQTEVVMGHGIDHAELMALAERCHKHLAQATASNSPSRRYSLILERLRKEAINTPRPTSSTAGAGRIDNTRNQLVYASPNVTGLSRCQAVDENVSTTIWQGPNQVALTSSPDGLGSAFDGMNWILQEWQTEDWTNLDSMVSDLPCTRPTRRD